MNTHRLFDSLDLQLKNGSIESCLVAKEHGQWRSYSTDEVKTIVDQLSAGLIASGISSGDMTVEGRDKIAIICKNRPEWMFIDLAIQQIGAVLIPIYPTAHVNDIAFIFKDANVKMVFVNDHDLLEKAKAVISQIEGKQEIYTIEQVPGVKNWTELLTLGKPEDYSHIKIESAKVTGDDLFTIIYTSGTTGVPKGVMLSHNNVYSNVMATMPFFPIGRNTRVLSFLPLNHIFERMVTYVYLFAGASIYYAENLDNLGDTIREVKPEMFTTVPRLLEKVYERIMAKGNEQTGIRRKLFFWALKLGEQYDINQPGSFSYRAQLALANRLVYNKWRIALGASLKCIVTGAAACQVKLIKIFTAGGVPILEGYGLTETSPVISVNKLNPGERMFGTVGPVIKDVQVKIEPDGEILCKGPNVMMGYYKKPEVTAENIIDGWFHTGDIGVLIDNKFLKITDRKKEIFKTSGGKYVAPQPIENKLVESPLIEQVMVVGAGEKFAGALVVPAFNVIREKFRDTGMNEKTTPAEIIADPQVVAMMHAEVEEMNKNFNQVEQIKKIALLPQEWTVEGGELTPTLKLKRKVIMEKNAEQIRRIFHH